MLLSMYLVICRACAKARNQMVTIESASLYSVISLCWGILVCVCVCLWCLCVCVDALHHILYCTLLSMIGWSQLRGGEYWDVPSANAVTAHLPLSKHLKRNFCFYFFQIIFGLFIFYCDRAPATRLTFKTHSFL